jgi:AraC-like DNA-binding protein
LARRFGDPYVARALALLHHDITRPWNVDDLSREVGLSRSALADRFINLIGMPPMHYVASWRMQVATQKLRNTSASLAQVADLVGYSSEAAFSRAFKKAFGTAPATLATFEQIGYVQSVRLQAPSSPPMRLGMRYRLSPTADVLSHSSGSYLP